MVSWLGPGSNTFLHTITLHYTLHEWCNTNNANLNVLTMYFHMNLPNELIHDFMILEDGTSSYSTRNTVLLWRSLQYWYVKNQIRIYCWYFLIKIRAWLIRILGSINCSYTHSFFCSDRLWSCSYQKLGEVSVAMSANWRNLVSHTGALNGWSVLTWILNMFCKQRRKMVTNCSVTSAKNSQFK